MRHPASARRNGLRLFHRCDQCWPRKAGAYHWDRSGLVLDIGLPKFPERIWVQGDILASQQFSGSFFSMWRNVTDLSTILVQEKQCLASGFSSFLSENGMTSTNKVCKFWVSSKKYQICPQFRLCGF